MSHSQLNKLKSAIKSRNDVTLNLLSNFIGNSNNENKLLLTDTQFSKTQLSKIVQLGRFILDMLIKAYLVQG